MQGKVFDPSSRPRERRARDLAFPCAADHRTPWGDHLPHFPARSRHVRERDATGTEGTEDRSKASLTSQRVRHDPITILVVDDDFQVRNTLSDYLRKEGHWVMTACDGVEGLKVAAQSRAQVVLTDIRMPEMDGIELCRRLHSEQPQLPVVLMSGWTADLDKVRPRKQGPRIFSEAPRYEALAQSDRDSYADHHIGVSRACSGSWLKWVSTPEPFVLIIDGSTLLHLNHEFVPPDLHRCADRHLEVVAAGNSLGTMK